MSYFGVEKTQFKAVNIFSLIKKYHINSAVSVEVAITFQHFNEKPRM